MGVLINVQVVRGGQAEAQLQFDSDAHRTIKIGRQPTAQLKLEDPKVARIHAVIEFSGGDASIIDMGSTFGTSVNGNKITNKFKLSHGDRIVLGDTTLVIGLGAAAVAQSAAPSPAAQQPAAPRQAPAASAPTVGVPLAAASAPGVVSSGQAPSARAFVPQALANAGMPAAASAGPQVAGGQALPRFDPGSPATGTPIERISSQRLRAAAVESKPHPALAPEDPITPDSRTLEMRVYWGTVLLDVEHYQRPDKITIGETRNTNVFISSEGLPTEEFPMIRYESDEYTLSFTTSMEGEVELKPGQVQSLAQLRGSSVATRDGGLEGTYRVKMPPEARAIVHWGGVTLAFRFVAPARPVPNPFWKNVDLQYLNFFLLSLFVHTALIATLVLYPYDTENLRDDLFDKPDRFAQLVLEEPKPDERKNLLDKLKKEEKKLEKKVEKDEPKEKVVSKQTVSKVPQDVKPERTREQQQAEVAQKFSKLFSGTGGGGGSILGGGGGGSLSGTLSNVIGTTGTGGSGGLAGLGIRGGSLTGGGIGTSRGIAGIGTAGRLGGGGLGYGSNVGGLKAGSDRGMINLSTPIVMGALPREVIQKVINDNKAQIRYCYEVELQRNQSLEGRVSIRWIIAATGSVAKAVVTDSTLKNPSVEACLVAKIKTWQFPAPAGGGIVEVNYPFVFKAS